MINQERYNILTTELEKLEEEKKELSLIEMIKENEKEKIQKELNNSRKKLKLKQQMRDKVIIDIKKRNKIATIISSVLIGIAIFFFVQTIFNEKIILTKSIMMNSLISSIKTIATPILVLISSLLLSKTSKNICSKQIKKILNSSYYNDLTIEIELIKDAIEKKEKEYNKIAEEYLDINLKNSVQTTLIKLKKEEITTLLYFDRKNINTLEYNKTYSRVKKKSN